MFRKLIILFISFLLMLSLNSYSNPAQDSSQLFLAKTLKCYFPIGAIGLNLNKGKDFSVKTNKDKMDMIFDAINRETNKARLIGNVGAEDVILLITNTGMTFLEKTLEGNLIITSVFSSRNQQGKFPAVMSRHILINVSNVNDIIPSQWYGWCEIWN